MNISFWNRIASLWVDICTAEDKERAEAAFDLLFDEVMQDWQEEKPLLEVLLSDLDEEDDDGY